MYKFKSRVRFSETDHDKKLSLISIIDYFQDCSTFHSEDLGVGIDVLAGRRMTWLLAGWQIIVDRYPELCENITAATWPYSFRGFFGNRNFAIFDESGQMAAYANSIWILIDLDTGKPIKVPQDIQDKYTIEPEIDMDYAPRKIKIAGQPEICGASRVYKHQTDANNSAGAAHMNNGQYVLVARELLPDDADIKQVRVDYRKAAVLDDVIIPKLYKSEDTYTVALESRDEDIFAIVEFKVRVL